MLTLHRRRKIGGTVTYPTNPHAQHFRACNADQFEDDLSTARGMVRGIVLGVLLWAAIVFVAWVS